MSVGAAASLLIAVLISNAISRSSLSALAEPEPALSGELAALWTESRAELPSVWQTEAGASRAEALPEESLLTAGYVESSEDGSVALAAAEAPSWMTAALLAQAGNISDESAEVRMEN
jgi:hypothetical protein